MQGTTYDPRYFDFLVALESRHFWFRSRNEVIASAVCWITSQWRPGYRVLEVGCGNGNVLQCLSSVCTGATVIGMDLFEEALRYAKRRSRCPLVRGDVHKSPVRGGFELIGLFDVLEHLPDDHEILTDLHRLLAPQGTLLLTVPAHMSLWSYFDISSHHCRRYSRAQLRKKLESAGFDIVYLTEFMAPLFPLVWLGRRLSKLLSRGPDGPEAADKLASRDFTVIPILNEILVLILNLEARLIARRWTIPIGTSLLAVARRVQPITVSPFHSPKDPNA